MTALMHYRGDASPRVAVVSRLWRYRRRAGSLLGSLLQLECLHP